MHNQQFPGTVSHNIILQTHVDELKYEISTFTRLCHLSIPSYYTFPSSTTTYFILEVLKNSRSSTGTVQQYDSADSVWRWKGKPADHIRSSSFSKSNTRTDINLIKNSHKIFSKLGQGWEFSLEVWSILFLAGDTDVDEDGILLDFNHRSMVHKFNKWFVWNFKKSVRNIYLCKVDSKFYTSEVISTVFPKN